MNRISRAFIPAVFFLSAFCVPNGSAAEKVSLRLNPEEGKTYERRAGYVQKITLGRGERRQILERIITVDVSSTVTGVDQAGVISVMTRYVSLRFKQIDSSGIREYDSDRPSAEVPPPVRDLAGLVGSRFLMRLSPEGRILEIEGIDAGTVGQVAGFFPGVPVGIGDSWSAGIKPFSHFPVTMDNTLTLVGRNGDLATVEVRSAVRQEAGNSSLMVGPVKLGYGIDGTLEGTMELEVSSGWPTRASLKHLFSGEVGLDDSLDLPVNVSLPFNGEGSFTIEPIGR